MFCFCHVCQFFLWLIFFLNTVLMHVYFIYISQLYDFKIWSKRVICYKKMQIFYLEICWGDSWYGKRLIKTIKRVFLIASFQTMNFKRKGPCFISTLLHHASAHNITWIKFEGLKIHQCILYSTETLCVWLCLCSCVVITNAYCFCLLQWTPTPWLTGL